MAMIRKLRTHRRLRQLDVARALGTTVQFVSNLERGLSPIPPSQITALAGVLGVSRESLIDLEVARYQTKLREIVYA